MLSGKKVLIGITGGIAAYKIPELVRLFKKSSAEVTVVLTPSAKEFVTETTLSTLSQNKVYCEQFNIEEWKPDHISLADSADVFVIAPASANTIGKIANGICDNLLTSLICAFKKPVIVAPAMNCNMWENKFVQENILKLSQTGFNFVEPEEGFLACGYEGKGRMASIQAIFDKTSEALKSEQFLKNKKILITAGGTKEELDPVRYIGNYSSGKMGIALADKAFEAGAEVELITTVAVKRPYKVSNVTSAQEMLNAVENSFDNSDALIMAAAVADYRPKNRSEQKIKKNITDELTLELVKTPDILALMAVRKKENQLVIGFCAESENLIENARKKIQNKKCDFIIANDISNQEITFGSNENEVFIVDKNFETKKIEKANKALIAKKILENIFKQ